MGLRPPLAQPKLGFFFTVHTLFFNSGLAPHVSSFLGLSWPLFRKVSTANLVPTVVKSQYRACRAESELNQTWACVPTHFPYSSGITLATGKTKDQIQNSSLNFSMFVWHRSILSSRTHLVVHSSKKSPI